MLAFNIKRLNRCDLFIASWVLYYLQGIIYSEGGVISQALLIVNLLISAKCAIKEINLKDNPNFFKKLNLLILLFTIYGIAHIISFQGVIYYPLSGKEVQSYNYLKSIYLSLLPIYAFYYYAKVGYLTQERLQRWGAIFLISATLTYFRMQQEALAALIEKGTSTEEITNNTGYLFLSCIPLLALYRKKPIVQFTLLFYVMAFIVMGMKRGAIGIGVIVSFYFMWKAIKNSNGKTKFVFIVLSTCICVAIGYFVIYMMTNSEYMIQRIEATLEGNSSGRDDLYSFFWTYFTEKASILHFLLGRGADGTLEIYDNFAHNDWLEIAVNQGLLGIIVYAVYWKNFYSTWSQATNIEAKTILALVGIIYFAKTIFSMSYGDMTYLCSSVFGYALATLNKDNF